jgi:hypothetical protein
VSGILAKIKTNLTLSNQKTMLQQTFAEILEAVENFPIDAQEDLILILKNRIRDQKRLDLIVDVKEVEKETRRKMSANFT